MKTIKLNKHEIVNLIEDNGIARNGNNVKIKIDPTNGKVQLRNSDNSSTYTEVDGKQIFWDSFEVLTGWEDWDQEEFEFFVMNDLGDFIEDRIRGINESLEIDKANYRCELE